MQGSVSRKSQSFVKLPPAHSVKLVFSYVVKGIKIKISAKFRASRRLGFEDKKITMSRPKCVRKVSGLSRNGPQAPVVQRVDSGIQ